MPHIRFLTPAWLLLTLAAGCSRQPSQPIESSFLQAEAAPAKAPEAPIVGPVQNPIGLNVVYPAPTDLVRVRDSSFLFGSVASKGVRLTINGTAVRVWPNGAWLAWLAFPPDTVMQFRIVARSDRDSVVLLYPVRRDPRFVSIEVRSGSVWIDSVSLSPKGQVWVPPQEYLTFSMKAAEGSVVRLRLPDGDMLPLVPQQRPAEVLPAIRAFDRDTAKLRTVDEVRYVGVVRGRAIGPDPGPVLPGRSAVPVRALTQAALWCVIGGPCPAAYQELLPPDAGWASVEAEHEGDIVRVRWPIQVALLDTLPTVAEFNDDTAAMGTTDSTTNGRAVPGGAYEWFFPTGTRALISGRINEDLRIELSDNASAWVPVSDAIALPAGIPAPRGVVGSVSITRSSDRVSLRIPVSERVPFQVLETERTLTVRFYRAVGDVDWIRYGNDPLVRSVSWNQPERDEVSLTVELNAPVWGYRTRWDRSDLLLEVRRPPPINRERPFRGRIIAVDPGHPPLGANGPTGLREADANLAVAQHLRRLLERAGARVFMTRTADTAIDLWRRVALADSAGAEVLVSIHNNALPDGVNPFTNNGTSVFYNQPRSLPLAAAIQRALVKRLNLPDLGISRGDLALVRPTWMPAVLCEGMFMTLPEQEMALRTSRGQLRYAQGVFEGIDRYLRDWDSRTGRVVRREPRASP
jgi:N-acetylmuramoyl-L-alanine amidase